MFLGTKDLFKLRCHAPFLFDGIPACTWSDTASLKNQRPKSSQRTKLRPQGLHLKCALTLGFYGKFRVRSMYVRNTIRKISNSNYCMMMKLEKPLHYRNYVLENVKTVIVFRVPRSKVHIGDQIIILLTGFKTVSEFSKFSQGLLILFVYLFFKRLQSDLFW